MSDSSSANTSLPEVIIFSKRQRVIIYNSSDRAFEILFDSLWASMNGISKRPTDSNDSLRTSSSRCYFRCGILETGSPAIIPIVSHQVLRQSFEHGTSLLGIHFVATVHIAQLKRLPESEIIELTSSTVAETALDILMRQGSRGILIVSSQRKLIFNIYIFGRITKFRGKPLERGCTGLSNCRISARHLDLRCYLVICFST